MGCGTLLIRDPCDPHRINKSARYIIRASAKAMEVADVVDVRLAKGVADDGEVVY